MGNFCVYTEGENFKNIVSEYNVDSFEMELAIFKWMEQNDKVWSAETDSELRTYLNDYFSKDSVFPISSNKGFAEASKIYEDYGLLENASFENATQRYNELKEQLGDNAVSIYKNSNGLWNVRMKMPVNQQGYTSKTLSIKEKAIKDGTFMKADISSTLQKLKTFNNKSLKSFGSTKSLSEKLKGAGIPAEVVKAITTLYEKMPSVKDLNPSSAFSLAVSLQYNSLINQYYKSVANPVNEKLEEYLVNWLKQYNININVGEAIKNFGNVNGVFDIINKIIYLANNRNELTLPEEFGHAFVELMGSTVSSREENKDFTFLMNTVENTDLYKKVYEDYKDIYIKNDKPDIFKIKKEAIGQAIGLSLIQNFEGSTQEEKTFFQKLKEFIDKILAKFKGIEYISFESMVDTISKEILSNNTQRLEKVDMTGYKMLDYYETIEQQNKMDNGKALEFMQYFSNIGNAITGSLAYRLQGETYRSKLDSLHDIDMQVPASAHGLNFESPVMRSALLQAQENNKKALLDYLVTTPYFEKIKNKYPKVKFGGAYQGRNSNVITVNAVYSEDESLSERFLNYTGSYADRLSNFTEEERRKIYLFDFFLNGTEDYQSFNEPEYNLNLVSFDKPFREKRYMGRAKDIMDYQNWKLFDEYKNKILPKEDDLMYQLNDTDDDIRYTETSEEDLMFEATEEDLAASIEQDYALMLEANPVLKQRFGDKKVISLGEILNNAVNDKSPWSPLIKKMLPKLGELLNMDVKLDIDYSVDREFAAYYEADTNTITVYGNYKNIDQNLIHEVLHAVIYNNMNKEEYKKDFDKLFSDIKSRLLEKHGVKSLDEIENDAERRLLYGLSSADEFVSEYYSNPAFRKEVLSLDKTSEKESVLTRIANFVKKILRIDTKGRITKLLEKVVSSYDGTIAFERKALSANKKENNTFPSREITKEEAKQVLYDYYLNGLEPYETIKPSKETLEYYAKYRKRYPRGIDTGEVSYKEAKAAAKQEFPGIEFNERKGRLYAVRPSVIRNVNEKYVDTKQWIDNLSTDSLISEAQRILVEEADIAFNKAAEGAQLDLFEEMEQIQAEQIAEEQKTVDAHKEELNEVSDDENGQPVVNKTSSTLKEMFDNLKSRGMDFPLSHRQHLAKVVVNYTSAIIDRIQEQGVDYINEIFYEDPDIDGENLFKNSHFSEDTDFTKMPREQVIKKVGLENILTYVKEKYINPASQIVDDNIAANLQLAYDNFPALLLMANKDMILCEKYTIDERFDEIGYSEDIDEVGDFQASEQEIGETEAWGVRAKSISARNSMSTTVKRVIRRTPVYDENGNYKTDDYGYGYDVYCDPDKLSNILLDKLTDCLDVKQMKSVLRLNEKTFPEFKSILQKLDENKEFADLFFSNFNKDKTIFYCVDKIWNDEKKVYEYVTIPLNSSEFNQDFFGAILEKRYLNQWGLWNTKTKTNDEGGKKQVFADYNTASKGIEQLNDIVSEIKSKLNKDKKADVSGEIRKAFNVLGIEELFTSTQIESIATDKDIVNTLVSELGAISRKLGDIVKSSTLKDEDGDTIVMVKNESKMTQGADVLDSEKGNYIRGELKRISEVLEKYAAPRVESMTHRNHKSYFAFSNPSLLGILKRKIHQGRKAFEKWVKEEYGKTNFFYNKDKDTGIETWYNDWLNTMLIDDSTRMGFDVQSMIDFNGNDYVDMGTTAFEACCVLNYFAYENKAWYKEPIPSDKNAFEFVSFRKIPVENHSQIISSFRKNITQEILRVNAVLRRSLNKNIAKIDYYDINKLFNTTQKDINGDEYTPQLKENEDGTLTLSIEDYRRVFTKENLQNTGAAFHFFPFLNEEVLNETKLGKMIFKKIKGESVNENEFIPLVEDAVSKYMEKVAEEDLENFESHGLLDFETTVKYSFDNFGYSYEHTNSRFLSVLHDSEAKIKEDFGEIFAGLDTYAGQIDLSKLSAAQIDNMLTYGLLKRNEDGSIGWNTDVVNKENKVLTTFIQRIMRSQLIDKLKEYSVGNYYGRLNLIQLTVTDIANFGDVINFQKRFAMTHSPGIRPNTEATVKVKNGESFENVLVSDGYARTITLKDNKVSSNIMQDVVDIFLRKAETFPKNSAERNYYMYCAKEAKNWFAKINQTDAQAYTSPTAMRKKLAMVGKWNDEREEAYQRILAGDTSLKNVSTVLEVLKPFVAANEIIPSGVSGNGTLNSIKTSIQHKDSEYMLLLAYALAKNENKQSALVQLYEFMEDTHFKEGSRHDNINYKTNGIDTILFESAVKVGGRATIDLSSIKDVSSIKETLNKLIYAQDQNGETLRNDYGDRVYNHNYVTTYSYEYYSFQQEVPNHMREHEQLDGSQQRVIVTADQNMEGTIDMGGLEGEINTRDAINEYYELIAENIHDSEQELLADLLLDKNRFLKNLEVYVNKANKKETEKDAKLEFVKLVNRNFRNIPASLKLRILSAYKKGASVEDLNVSISQADRNYALSMILQDQLKNDAKFDSDMFRGCSIDENGKFVIPLGDPIQSAVLQQQLTSLVKSRINKQKVKGGPAVQVSSWGIGEDLKTVFKTDANGNKVISHMECYMTCPSEELEQRMSIYNEKGEYVRMRTIEEALEEGVISEDELLAIGYRIPTEDTYSIIPMKIVGFLPKFCGDTIMLPTDHVEITGSDFDIDKFYIKFRETPRKLNKDTLFKEYRKRIYKSKEIKGKEAKNNFVEQVSKAFRDKDSWRKIQRSLKNNKSTGDETLDKIVTGIKGILQTSAYKDSFYKRENLTTRTGRNNRLFDLEYALLQTVESTEKMFNPGNFDDLKILSRNIVAEKGISYSGQNILTQKTDSYFYGQNTAAKKLIGIKANGVTSHAFCSLQDLKMKFKLPFKVSFIKDSDGKNVIEEISTVKLDPQRGKNGKLVSKVLGSCVGAAADAAKEPVFKNLNITPSTANVAQLLFRLGFPEDFVAYFLAQPILVDVVMQYERRNSYENVSIKNIIKNIFESQGFKTEKQIENKIKEVFTSTYFTADGFFEYLKDDIDSDSQMDALCLFYSLLDNATDLSTLTFLTKFNSLTNAAGPTISEALEMERKIARFMAENESIVGGKEVIKNNPLLKAFYSATIGKENDIVSDQTEEGALRKIMSPHFYQYSKGFQNVIAAYDMLSKRKADSDTIEKLAKFYALYYATMDLDYNIPKLIDGSEEARKSYMGKSFIQKVMSAAQEDRDNVLLNAFKIKEKTRTCNIDTINTEINGASSDFYDKIKCDWSEMVEKGGEEEDLIKDIAKYCMYRNGFTYSPMTPLHTTNVDLKLALESYVPLIEKLVNTDPDGETIKRIIEQFKRNNTHDTNIVPEIYKKSLTNASNQSVIQIIDNGEGLQMECEKSILNKLSTSNVETSYEYIIKYNDNIYRLEEITPIGKNNIKLVYKHVSKLGIKSNFMEVNGDLKEKEEMNTIVDQINLEDGGSQTLFGTTETSNNPENDDDLTPIDTFTDTYDEYSIPEDKAEAVINIANQLNDDLTSIDTFTDEDIVYYESLEEEFNGFINDEIKEKKETDKLLKEAEDKTCNPTL